MDSLGVSPNEEVRGSLLDFVGEVPETASVILGDSFDQVGSVGSRTDDVAEVPRFPVCFFLKLESSAVFLPNQPQNTDQMELVVDSDRLPSPEATLYTMMHPSSVLANRRLYMKSVAILE